MPAPSKLSIATSSVNRLVKEESSYYKELEQQQKRIKDLGEAGNNEDAEYQLKQEKQGLEETKAVLPSIRQKIVDAVAKLELELEANKDAGGEASTEEVTKAKDAIAAAKTSMREIA